MAEIILPSFFIVISSEVEKSILTLDKSIWL